jgi:hypothetical protein
MRKMILAATAIILLLAVAGLACWIFMAQKTRHLSSWTILPDGNSVRIVAVTYGTNHVVGTRVGQKVGNLPVGFQNILKRLLGHRATPLQTVTTTTPELVVWIDYQTNSAGGPAPASLYYNPLLGDGSNFISGDGPFMFGYFSGPTVDSVRFNTFPRRDPILTLNLFHQNSQGAAALCASLPFANPLYRQYPEWQPETLPLTKRAGDLEVTLKSVETGHDNSMTSRSRPGGGQYVTFGTNRTDGRNYTVVDIKLRPLTNTNEAWHVAGIEISDATGNRARNGSMSWSGDAGTFSFTPSLWPGEKAWKLKLDLKRTAGFHPEELIEFKDVPLGELNRTSLVNRQTNSGGLTVALQSISRRAPFTNSSWSSSQLSEVKLTNSTLPAGTYLDLLSVVWNPGKTNNPESSSWSDTERTYGFREVPTKAQTADFVFVLQKSRILEFTVKPELPKPAADAKTQR